MTTTNMSEKYSLNKADLIHILKVMGFVVASAVVSYLIKLIPDLNVPNEYLFLIPIVNMVLVTLERFCKSQTN